MISNLLFLRLLKHQQISSHINGITIESSNLRGILEDMERDGFYFGK
jgi:hypothetical protein